MSNFDNPILKLDKIAKIVEKVMNDPVNHPQHYNSHPSGVECITITEHMSFNVGNAIKYLWRAGLKTGPQPPMEMGAGKVFFISSEQHLEDLKKAAWYINREIEKLRKENVSGS